MEIFLLSTFHNDAHPERDKELKTVLDINLRQNFDKVYVFGDTSPGALLENSKLTWCPVQGDRPTVGHYLQHAKTISSDRCIFIMANADIFITNETLNQIKFFYEVGSRRDVFMALSRWDIHSFNPEAMTFTEECFCRVDSQDTFIFCGSPRFLESELKWGWPGTDNCITYQFNQHGYRVINPARSIKTYHHHASNQKNYYKNGVQVIPSYPPPYLLVESTTLEALQL